jgi:hypothetical protein
MLSDAAISVAHSHGCERTKASPSRSAPRSESSVEGAGSERTRSAQMHTALIAKVAASTRNAPPTPRAATIKPPSAGPSSRSQP